eukprot:282601-Pleurochrysis_carterae.AAC.4
MAKVWASTAAACFLMTVLSLSSHAAQLDFRVPVHVVRPPIGLLPHVVIYPITACFRPMPSNVGGLLVQLMQKNARFTLCDGCDVGLSMQCRSLPYTCWTSCGDDVDDATRYRLEPRRSWLPLSADDEDGDWCRVSSILYAF